MSILSHCLPLEDLRQPARVPAPSSAPTAAMQLGGDCLPIVRLYLGGSNRLMSPLPQMWQMRNQMTSLTSGFVNAVPQMWQILIPRRRTRTRSRYLRNNVSPSPRCQPFTAQVPAIIACPVGACAPQGAARSIWRVRSCTFGHFLYSRWNPPSNALKQIQARLVCALSIEMCADRMETGPPKAGTSTLSTCSDSFRASSYAPEETYGPAGVLYGPKSGWILTKPSVDRAGRDELKGGATR
jgi:hypothetical protein